MTPPSIAIEPTPSRYPHPVARYFAATRPAFLAATLVACLIGLSVARHGGVALDPVTAGMSLLLALIVHAAVNVLNDYYDALNGTDVANQDRVFPFTGGSRFIQNGVLTPAQTARFGYALLSIAAIGGIVLAWHAGWGLLLVGAVGLLVGWAYSAEPLRWNARGLGEACVLVGFLGVVLGADYVQRHAVSVQPLLAGLPYALLVTNLLYINQFPDRKADAAAGKRHWVVRLPPAAAVQVYPLLALLAFVWLVLCIFNGDLPAMALLSALPMLLAVQAARLLARFAAAPHCLLPAIRLTLLAMLGHGLFLTLILFLESR